MAQRHRQQTAPLSPRNPVSAMDVDSDRAARFRAGEFDVAGDSEDDVPDYSPDGTTSPATMEAEATPERFDQTPLDRQGSRMATAMPGRVCIGNRRDGGVANGHNHERKTREDIEEGPDQLGREVGIFGTSMVSQIWPLQWGEAIPDHLSSAHLA
jgi:hypothetical protein